MDLDKGGRAPPMHCSRRIQNLNPLALHNNDNDTLTLLKDTSASQYQYSYPILLPTRAINNPIMNNKIKSVTSFCQDPPPTSTLPSTNTILPLFTHGSQLPTVLPPPVHHDPPKETFGISSSQYSIARTNPSVLSPSCVLLSITL